MTAPGQDRRSLAWPPKVRVSPNLLIVSPRVRANYASGPTKTTCTEKLAIPAKSRFAEVLSTPGSFTPSGGGSRRCEPKRRWPNESRAQTATDAIRRPLPLLDEIVDKKDPVAAQFAFKWTQRDEVPEMRKDIGRRRSSQASRDLASAQLQGLAADGGQGRRLQRS